MSENSPQTAAIPWSVRITIGIAVCGLGALAVLLFMNGIRSLYSSVSIQYRYFAYFPWFSVPAIGLVICWGLWSRRWWGTLAMLLWLLANALLLLVFLFSEPVVKARDPRGLIFVPLVPLVAICLVVAGAIHIQRRWFDQPELAAGGKRRMQWPLWIWIPAIFVVGLEGWRIRTADLHRQFAEAQFNEMAEPGFKFMLEALLDNTRAGRPPGVLVEDFYSFKPGQQTLITALPAALADESDAVQKLALQICGEKSNQEWISVSGSPWFANCSVDDKANLLQALRAYEQNPNRPPELRAEAKAAADWFEMQMPGP